MEDVDLVLQKCLADLKLFFLFLVIIVFFFCLLLHFDRGCVLIYTTFIRKSAGEKYLMPSLDAEKFNLGEQFFRFFFSSILWIIHIFFFKKKLQIILKNPLKLIF